MLLGRRTTFNLWLKACSWHIFLVEILGTVDFVLPDGTVVFRTCDAEKEKVVFQMVGTKEHTSLHDKNFVFSIFSSKFVIKLNRCLKAIITTTINSIFIILV